MRYVFGPNRDSGSVRRHRNPDTKRHYIGGNSAGACTTDCTRCTPALQFVGRRRIIREAAIREEMRAWEMN